jgi:hypothetical protein
MNLAFAMVVVVELSAGSRVCSSNLGKGWDIGWNCHQGQLRNRSSIESCALFVPNDMHCFYCGGLVCPLLTMASVGCIYGSSSAKERRRKVSILIENYSEEMDTIQGFMPNNVNVSLARSS